MNTATILLAYARFTKTCKLKIFKVYESFVTIIIPVYKEAKVIGKKIECIAGLVYPKHKLQVIIIGDSETLESAMEKA